MTFLKTSYKIPPKKRKRFSEKIQKLYHSNDQLLANNFYIRTKVFLLYGFHFTTMAMVHNWPFNCNNHVYLDLFQ